MASPMDFRAAWDLAQRYLRDIEVSCSDDAWKRGAFLEREQLARARSIVDAAVEDIERIPALKLAAYRAGVESAAKACEADAGRYCEAHPWSASDQRAVQAFDAGYTSGAYGGAKAARAVPDPAPEQLEEIK